VAPLRAADRDPAQLGELLQRCAPAEAILDNSRSELLPGRRRRQHLGGRPRSSFEKVNPSPSGGDRVPTLAMPPLIPNEDPLRFDDAEVRRRYDELVDAGLVRRTSRGLKLTPAGRERTTEECERRMAPIDRDWDRRGRD
jgi:hypothetical protein